MPSRSALTRVVPVSSDSAAVSLALSLLVATVLSSIVVPVALGSPVDAHPGTPDASIDTAQASTIDHGRLTGVPDRLPNRAKPSSCPAVNARRDSTATDENGSISLEYLHGSPSLYDDLTNATAIQRARREGRLGRAPAGENGLSEIRLSETLVYRFTLSGDATRLFDALADKPGATPTERFAAFVPQPLDADGIDDEPFDAPVRLTVHDDALCPYYLNWTASTDRDAVRVVPDRDADALSIVFDADRAVFSMGIADRDPAPGVYRANLTVGTPYHQHAVERRLRVRGHRVSFADDVLVLDATSNATIAGRTTRPPGDRVFVDVWTPNVDTLDVTVPAVVNDSGGFTATVDLSGVEPGTELRIGSRYADREVTALVGVVGMVAIDPDQVSWHRLGGVSGFLEDGGFLVVRDADGAVRGTEHVGAGRFVASIRIAPSMSSGGTLTVTAYRDSDGDGEFDGPAVDRPYGTNDAVVAASVAVDGRETTTAASATATTATATDGTPMRTAANASNGSVTERRTSTAGTATTGPGFTAGTVVAALVLVTAGLLARRRRRSSVRQRR